MILGSGTDPIRLIVPVSAIHFLINKARLELVRDHLQISHALYCAAMARQIVAQDNRQSALGLIFFGLDMAVVGPEMVLTSAPSCIT